MIVACPSCRRRYRHDFAFAEPAPTAHCSGCDERFALAEPKRTYRVLRPAGSPAAEGASPALSVACSGPPAVTPADAELQIEVPVASPVAVRTVSEPESPAARAGRAAALGRPARVPPRSASRRGAVVETLVALVPSGLGAGLAYHLAGPLGQDPITWAALGGAIGLLLGWACLLWITRGD